MEVWILFSVANDYNQPDKAFEKLFWTKPTAEELGKEIGVIPSAVESMLEGKHYGGNGNGRYWLECFKQ